MLKIWCLCFIWCKNIDRRPNYGPESKLTPYCLVSDVRQASSDLIHWTEATISDVTDYRLEHSPLDADIRTESNISQLCNCRAHLGLKIDLCATLIKSMYALRQ